MKKRIIFALPIVLLCIVLCAVLWLVPNVKEKEPTESVVENLATESATAEEKVIAKLEKGMLVERSLEEGSAIYYVDNAGDFITDECVLYGDTIYYFCESGYGLPYTVRKVNDHITGIMDAAADTMYVVTGSEKALVIDTMAGAGDMRKLVDLITDLPYDVVLTHGHLDHVGGGFDFEELYLSELDHSMVEESSNLEERMGYFYSSTQYGSVVIDPDSGLVGANDFAQYDSNVVLKALNEGDIFELGDGYTAEILSAPGHTDGSVAILFPQDRILLTGDAVNNYTYLQLNENVTIENYRQMLLKLKEREDEWDNLLFSHNNAELFPKTTIDDCIELCDEILETGGENSISMADMGYEEDVVMAAEVDWEQFCRPDGKVGNIVYRLSQIYNDEN